jgi:putative ABC transport system substrate-binding protein
MAIHIGRRRLIATLGGAAAWPLAARAQQPAMPVIGILHLGSPEANANVMAAFRHGLGESGYVEGRNIALEFSFGGGKFNQLPELATALVSRRVTLIAAFGDAAARAAKAATTSIPIVFAGTSDPVAVGLVSSLNRPGWNITGVSILNQELEAIRLERLLQVVPHATTIAVLINPDSLTADAKLRELEAGARMLDRRLEVFHARTEEDFETAFATAAQQQIRAMVVVSDTVFWNESADLGRASSRHTVATMGAYRPFTRAGGLMSYGSNLRDAYSTVGTCAARILKGENPANMPVQQVTKVEFVINLKTANTLGLKIPQGLLAIADEVIE